MTEAEATAAAELLSQLSIEFHPLQPLLREAVSLGLKLRHPAYDCMFLALAGQLSCPLVTADQALLHKTAAFTTQVMSLREAIERAY